MRNLKKVLALVLAMAMSLSLAVTAGAAFNDQDKIVNTEAVDMCVALNIINGRTDGSFDPAGNVTRAEMAKMICIVLNGGKEPTTATKAVPTFADIDGHWAEGYIEYCFAKGVVAGKSATEFAPNAGVTGTEAAKMLLVALGYNADVEKMVGANWALYTNVLANQTGLYEELEAMDPGAALSRDNAAQMIWNTLQALEIIRSSSIDREDGSINDSYAPGKVDLLTAKYGTSEFEGCLVDWTYNSDKAEWTYELSYTTIVTEDGKSSVVPATKYFTTDADYTDLFMQNVKVIYKAKDVYGIFANESTVIVADVIDNIADLAALGTTTDEVTVADVDYKVDTKADGTNVIDGAYAFGVPTNVSFRTIAGMAGYQAFEFKAIDNDDNGKIDTLVFFPFSVAEVTYVGAKGITAGAPFTFEDDSIYEGVAKEDYAVITAAANTDVIKNTVVKADLTTAKVTGVKTGAVQLDGAWYTETVSAAFEVGSSYDMVIINNVVLKAEKVDDASEDVLYITEVKATSNNEFASDDVTWDAKAYFVDGTSSVITVSKVGTTEGAKPAIKGLYTYEMDGDNYELTAVSDTNKAGFDGYVAGYSASVARFDESASTLEGKRIADDAVIFVQSKDEGKVEVDVISGKDLKAWSADFGDTAYVLTNEVNGIDYVQVAALIGEAVMPGADNDTLYGFVTADSWSTTIEDNGKDKSVVAVQIWTGTETVTLYDKDTTLSLTEGAIVSYKVDGLYADVAALGNAPVAITGFEYVAEGDVVYNTASDKGVTYALNEDVVFIGINTDDVQACEAITMADIQLAQSQTENYVTANAYVIVDNNNTASDVTDDTVIAIFMDTNNELVVSGTAAQYAK